MTILMYSAFDSAKLIVAFNKVNSKAEKINQV